MINNYFPLSPIEDVYIDKLNSLIDSAPSLEWKVVLDYQVALVDRSYLDIHPTIKMLSESYEMFPMLIKMDPYTHYLWHTDTERGVCINLLLSGYGVSNCLFGVDLINPLLVKFEELRYELFTPVVFNTQSHHQVLNFNSTRYMLSFCFKKTREELSYQTILDHIKA